MIQKNEVIFNHFQDIIIGYHHSYCSTTEGAKGWLEVCKEVNKPCIVLYYTRFLMEVHVHFSLKTLTLLAVPTDCSSTYTFSSCLHDSLSLQIHMHWQARSEKLKSNVREKALSLSPSLPSNLKMRPTVAANNTHNYLLFIHSKPLIYSI